MNAFYSGAGLYYTGKILLGYMNFLPGTGSGVQITRDF